MVEDQPSAAAGAVGEPGGSGDEGPPTAATGAAASPRAADSSSEEASDDSVGSEDADDTATATANGHAARLQNGHARSRQQTITEEAQHSGGSPDVAPDAADPEGAEQQAGPQSDGPVGVDPFLEDEPDPAKARALGSSLWEVDSLRNHYCQQARCRRTAAIEARLWSIVSAAHAVHLAEYRCCCRPCVVFGQQ